MDEMVARLYLYYSIGGIASVMDYADILEELGLVNPTEETIISETITKLIELDQRRKESAAHVSGSDNERDRSMV